jgi:hypothetical protein
VSLLLKQSNTATIEAVFEPKTDTITQSVNMPAALQFLTWHLSDKKTALTLPFYTQYMTWRHNDV